MNTSLLTIHQTPTSGLGVFTLQPIPAGTLLISETPAILITKPSLQITSDDLEAALSSLPAALLAQFHALSEPPTHHKTTELRKFFGNAIAYRGSADAACLCLDVARVNHSCAPNVELAWRQEAVGVNTDKNGDTADDTTTSTPLPRTKVELYATRDIAKGEELTFSYLSEVQCLPRSYRRFMLLLNWRFDCECSACGDDVTPLPAAVQASDTRRASLYKLHNELQNFSVPVISMKLVMRSGVPLSTWKAGQLQAILAGLWLPRSYPPPEDGVSGMVERWRKVLALCEEEGVAGICVAGYWGELVKVLRAWVEEVGDGDGEGKKVREEVSRAVEEGCRAMRRCRPADHPDVIEYERICKNLAQDPRQS